MSLALVFKGKGQLETQEIATLSQNRLRVIQTAICGSDRHIINGRLGDGPFVLGHEVVGVIERLDAPEELYGDKVAVGDRVIVVPGINCGKCKNCLLKNKYCINRFVYGFTPFIENEELNGAFSEMMDLKPGTKVFKVPDNVSDDKANFIEIMACAVGAIEKITSVRELSQVRKVLVLGAGPAGVSCFIAAKFYGMNAYIADIKKEAIDFIENASIDNTILLGDEELTEQFDVVIDCAGTNASFYSAINMVNVGGVVVEFGAFSSTEPVKEFPFWLICQKDLAIFGLAETLDRNFPLAIRIIEQTKYYLEALISNRFNLAEIEKIRNFITEMQVGKAIVNSF